MLKSDDLDGDSESSPFYREYDLENKDNLNEQSHYLSYDDDVQSEGVDEATQTIMYQDLYEKLMPRGSANVVRQIQAFLPISNRHQRVRGPTRFQQDIIEISDDEDDYSEM